MKKIDSLYNKRDILNYRLIDFKNVLKKLEDDKIGFYEINNFIWINIKKLEKRLLKVNKEINDFMGLKEIEIKIIKKEENYEYTEWDNLK